MNILFLNPPFKGRYSRTSRSPSVTKGGTLYYPIWLAYAAGVVEQAGHDVHLVDAPAEGLEMAEIFKKLEDINPRLAVVDTSTPSIYNDIETAAAIKDRYPHCFILIVGTHPSGIPEQTLNLNENIDAIALGEYDYTIRDLAAALENNTSLERIPGLVYRHEGKTIRTGEREKIKNLDEIPFVSSVYKKHLNLHNYFFAAANYPMIMIITGRGCPYRCFFCVYPQVFHNRGYRERTPENVVEEFIYIKNNFPEVKEIGIEDDCFSANKKRVEAICRLLIEKKVNMKWYCNVRGDLDIQLMKLMKKAGCRLITVGFESATQSVLDNIHKNEKVETYYQFASDAKKAGLLVHGCMMTGNPGDTLETLKQSYTFAKKINCDSMQFYPLYVYPGTEAYQWAKQKGFLKTENFSEWVNQEGLHNCVLSTETLSSTEMVYWCDYYLKKYHLRPRYLLMKLLQAIRHPGEGIRSLKSAKVFFSKIFKKQI